MLPVYNKEKYINLCLKSLSEQSYKNIEIIAINDGSNDRSEEIIKSWQLKDSRIKLINQENKGVAFTRNKGIEICNGEYIFFMDADDILLKNAISVLVEHAIRSNADITIANNFINNNGNLKKNLNFKNSIITKDENLRVENQIEMFIHFSRPLATVWNKLYKKEFLKKNKLLFDNNVLAEDRLFNLKCYVNSPLIKLVNIYTYIYNVTDNSRSRGTYLSVKFYNESINLLKFFNIYLERNKLKNEQTEKLLYLNTMFDIYKILILVSKDSEYNFKRIKESVNKLRKETIILKQRKIKNIFLIKYTYKEFRLFIKYLNYTLFLHTNKTVYYSFIYLYIHFKKYLSLLIKFLKLNR